MPNADPPCWSNAWPNEEVGQICWNNSTTSPSVRAGTPELPGKNVVLGVPAIPPYLVGEHLARGGRREGRADDRDGSHEKERGDADEARQGREPLTAHRRDEVVRRNPCVDRPLLGGAGGRRCPEPTP